MALAIEKLKIFKRDRDSHVFLPPNIDLQWMHSFHRIDQSVLTINRFIFSQLKLAFAIENNSKIFTFIACSHMVFGESINCCFVQNACEKYVKTPHYTL